MSLFAVLCYIDINGGIGYNQINKKEDETMDRTIETSKYCIKIKIIVKNNMILM